MSLEKYKRCILALVLSLPCSSQICANIGTYYNDRDSILISYTMNEVIIRSFKQSKDLSLEPIAASVMSGKQLQEGNMKGLKDLSGFIPNLFLPDYGSKMTSPVYIRGIGSRTNTPSVGLYVDGVPYFNRSAFDFNMNDVDYMEILRGPQGTLYGRNTMGGIINVYTKSPFKYKETNVNLSAGTYDNYEIGGSHYGNVDNKFGYSLSANYLSSGGYFKNVTTGRRADPMDAVAMRLRLSYKFSPRLSADLTSAYEYSDQDGYPYALYNKENNSIGDINYNAHSFYRRNISTTGANVEYLTNSYKLSSQSSFQYFDGNQGLDQDFSPRDIYYSDYIEHQQMYSQEFNIKSLGKSNYQWQYGLFGFYQNYFYTNDISTLDANMAAKTFEKKIQDVDNPTMGAAVYHQSTINNIVIRGLSLSLGLRYDWEKTKAQTRVREAKVHEILTDKYTLIDKNVLTERNTLTEKKVKGDDHFSQFTPKLALQYTFLGNKIVYGSITKGYKSGGFNSTAQLEKDFSYDPEHSWSYELGGKASLLDSLINMDVTLFYINWEDQQISQTQPDGKGYILRNAGKSQSKGVEVALRVNPLKNLTFNLNYGYTHAIFKRYQRDANTNYDGKYLPMLPKHTFSLSGNYGLFINNSHILDKVIFNVQYKGQGKLFWKEDNAVSQPFYGLIDGRVSFIKKTVSLDFWMKNITNKKYVSYYFVTSKAYAQQGKPFACGMTINVTF